MSKHREFHCLCDVWLADVDIATSLTPVLINRAALSLRKSADRSKVNESRKTGYLSSIRFGPKSTAAVSEIIVGQPLDSPTGTRMDTGDLIDISADVINARDLGRSLDQDSQSVV